MPIRPRSLPRSSRSGILRHWTLWAWFVAALVICLGGVSFWKSGRWLVHEDAFDKVRWGVVLAGESRDCERSDAAIRLFHEGKLDTLIISACRVFKTRYNSEFMVDYFVQQGVPRDRVFEFRQDAYSTIEEARLLVRQFRLQNLDTVVIVTTTFHTARTRRIFRKLAAGYPVVLLASADYGVYDPSAFWSNRESLKLWFDEWAKTFFTVFELAKAKPETGKAEYQGLTPDIWSTRSPAEFPAPAVSTSSDTPGAPAGARMDTADGKSESVLATGSASSPADSGRESPRQALAGTGDGKTDAKSVLDSAVASKSDSVKARKDSIRAHKDSVKAKAAEEKTALALKEMDKKSGADAKSFGEKSLEGKTAAKDTLARKSLPRAPKKPAASTAKAEPKDVKKTGTSAKDASKASDKKMEKTRTKKKE
ncbi:MAG: hypothetical protein JWP91_2441 [Fibrobacteres bacterium]|nr:hypothetical protein [Fibrobacterota bacterium]